MWFDTSPMHIERLLTPLRSISITSIILLGLGIGAMVGFAALSLPGDPAILSVRDIDAELIDERLALVASWTKQNQRSDGSLPYLYDPSADLYSDGDNVIRQLITVQGLYAASRHLNDESLKSSAERLEKNVFAGTYHSDAARKYSYFIEKAGIKLGAAALGILAVREKGDMLRPLTKQEVDLGQFILTMQRPDGSFQTFLQKEQTSDNDRFYSGEALTALARLAAASDDSSYDEALLKGLGFYREKLKNDFWPQYTPWHMQAYVLAYQDNPKEEYAEYVFWLAEGLIQTMLEADREASAEERGRFYNLRYPAWGAPHSASTGIYVEGLTYAYELATIKADKRKMRRYKEAILLGTRSLLQVQWTPELTLALPRPERATGSFKETPAKGDLRIDQLGHAANALVRVRETVLDE